MKKHICISLTILLILCLAGCASHTDKTPKDEPKAEVTKAPEAGENTNAEKQVEETPVPSETPTVENEAMAEVSILEHFKDAESIDVEYDKEHHYIDRTLGSIDASRTIISGVYMDGQTPFIIADNIYHGCKIRRYKGVTGPYENVTKLESENLPRNCSDEELNKMDINNPWSTDAFLSIWCERNGIDDRGGNYLFTQARWYHETYMNVKPVDFLDFPALWLFDEKGNLTKRISWARLTGIEKLQKETTSKRSCHYPCAYVVSDTMHDGIMYFTFTVIDSAGKNKETRTYYYAALDTETETLLFCEEIDFEWPKIYGDYLVGITPDYKKIVVQNTKTGKKKKIKNTAGQHILGYAMGGACVYWMDMDNIYQKDIVSGKKETQPMDLREAIGSNVLMNNNIEEGWQEVAETIKTESCAMNNLTVSEDGKLYGVFWSYEKYVDDIETCFCDYMVLKFDIPVA